jgi:hypothetical protein
VDHNKLEHDIERYHHVGVYGLQTTQLFDHKKQKETEWPRRVQEVLSVLREAYYS